MNIDIMKYMASNDYQALFDITKEKEDHLSRFYYLLSCYYLDNKLGLFTFLENTDFNKYEIVEIYDCLDSKSSQKLNEAKRKLKEKYANYLITLDAYKEDELRGVINKINLPKKETEIVNINFYFGIIILFIGLISALITILVSIKLKEEIIYFCTILLMAIPGSLLVLGANLILFKRQNILLMVLEAFILVYFLSFICLIKYFNGDSFLDNVKNHFFSVINAIYDFFYYYAYKALEGLE